MSDVDLDEAVNAVNMVGTTVRDPNKRHPKAVSAGYVANIDTSTTSQKPTAKSDIVGTPRRAHANSVLLVNDEVKDAALKIYLRDVFTEQIHRDYPVVEFVKKVFKFSPSDIPGYNTGKIYHPPTSHFNSYVGSVGERNSYEPLKSIFDDLLRQLCPEGEGRHLLTDFVFMYERQPESHTGAKLKPDILISTNPDKQSQTWMAAQGYGEVKPRRKDKKIQTVPRRKTIDLAALEREPTLYIPIMPKATPEPEKSPSPASSSQSNPLKRKCASPEDDKKSKATLPVHKRCRANDTAPKTLVVDVVPANTAPPEPDTFDAAVDAVTACRALTENELQSAKYINEMMSHGVRNFSTGWLLEETSITLWYADRMGLVQSASFDFLEKPHLLLLFVAAYAFADLAKLGLCPLLTCPCIDGKFSDYKDATLNLSVAQDMEQKHTGLSFEVDPDWPIQTDLGTIGRGTTIVPVTATGKALKLYGQGHLVAKLAWPAAGRTGEDVFIRKIRQGLKKKPEYLRHIVDLKCSMSQTMAESGLPRALMEDLPELPNHEPRVFRCLVMREYVPLELVDNVEEFKIIFIDTVRAHYWVYMTSGVLHRDVSIGNLMFYRESDGTVRGVLCDWDLASDKKDEKSPHREIMEAGGRSEEMKKDEILLEKGHKEDQDHVGPCYRTGTGPFMALDLLAHSDPPVHQYRFDLESFFFVLVWHCAVYDPETRTYGHIKNWESKDLNFIGDTKRLFLGQLQIREQVFKEVHPQYLPVVNTWVKSLARLFRPVNVTDWYTWHALIQDHMYAKTRGNLELQQKAEREAAKYAKQRDEGITYEKFMACLGQDVSEEL